MKKALTILLVLSMTVAMAQRHEIYDDNIATLQVVAGTDWLSPPVIQLGSDSEKGVLNISFDDFTHAYHRYTYKIEHCEADWSVSEELFTSDYIYGFAEGNTIDDSEESMNTNTLYTHYKLQIPNEKCALKMSGNYKLTVFDENEDNRKILTACFMVVEPKMNVGLSVTTNTDVDINESHQQVSMQVGYGSVNVTDPVSQIKTVVMQNGRWSSAKRNVKPQYIMQDGLKWEHNRDLVFTAGNEYHKFEILDVTHPTMGIDQIEWDEKDYHVYPFICEPRPNYVYDEDADGSFYIRNSDNVENDVTAEYVYVHYQLKCPLPVNGQVYLNGAWTNDRFIPKYEMLYDMTDKSYKAVIKQKQGYYSYQILMLDCSGMIQIMPTEGSYYQTENKYQAFVYFRAKGGRTDQLVGYQQVKLK